MTDTTYAAPESALAEQEDASQPRTFAGERETPTPLPATLNGGNGQNGHDDPGIALRIADIIAQRKPYRERVQRLQIQLNMLDGALRNLRDWVPNLQGEESYARLAALPFDSLIQRVGQQKAVLETLRARFQRETLNIAVVGIARMGKSRLLRSLSGLGPDVIPDRGGDPCTGVRSAIYDQPGGDTYAEIEYHTPQSLLEILWAYWDKIKLPLARPYNLDAFFSMNLPEEAPPSEHAAEHQK